MGMRYDAPADKHSFLREVQLWREHTRSSPCLSSPALCGPSPSRKSLRRNPRQSIVNRSRTLPTMSSPITRVEIVQGNLENYLTTAHPSHRRLDEDEPLRPGSSLTAR